MDWLTEPLDTAFMQRALLAAILVAVTTAVVGTWVVVRGMTFMGDALAHGVLPGIATAFLIGVNLTLGALAGAAVMAGGIAALTRRARVAADTAIGLMFVGMLAAGVVIISRAGSFAVELTGFLFGDVLSVTAADIWLQLAAAMAAILTTAAFYRGFLVLSFNEEKAHLLGLRPRLCHALMLGLIALAIVTSFRAVGTLLVFALLVAPPATAALVVRRVPTMIVAAVAIGVLSAAGGLLLSYHIDTAAGATVAALAVAVFFVVLAAREVAQSLGRRGKARAVHG